MNIRKHYQYCEHHQMPPFLSFSFYENKTKQNTHICTHIILRTACKFFVVAVFNISQNTLVDKKIQLILLISDLHLSASAFQIHVNSS